MTKNKSGKTKGKSAILHIDADIHKSLKLAAIQKEIKLSDASNAILKNGIPLLKKGEIKTGKGGK